jgi:phage terminase small subunit
MNIDLPATIGDGAALTPKQARFAALYSEYGNAARAYRQAFDCGPDTSPVTVRRMAYELVHTPKVATRIRALQAAAAEATVVSVRSRMVRLQLIVDADPSELVSIAGSACRHCHGEGHGYQWRDEAELATAVDRYMRALDASKPLQAPDTAGGFGFRGNREPNVNCPHCDGEGVARTIITPTDQLSASARALFKGVRQKANGEIEVMMHDQLAASDQLNKLQSAYVSQSINLNANVSVSQPSDLATPEALLAAFHALGSSR